MLREIIRPTSQNYNIKIPKEYINTEIEILVLPLINTQNLKDENDKELLAFSNHSANTISDWLDDSEDDIWK
jgi:hypothetical protein